MQSSDLPSHSPCLPRADRRAAQSVRGSKTAPGSLWKPRRSVWPSGSRPCRPGNGPPRRRRRTSGAPCSPRAACGNGRPTPRPVPASVPRRCRTAGRRRRRGRRSAIRSSIKLAFKVARHWRQIFPYSMTTCTPRRAPGLISPSWRPGRCGKLRGRRLGVELTGLAREARPSGRALTLRWWPGSDSVPSWHRCYPGRSGYPCRLCRRYLPGAVPYCRLNAAANANSDP
jgi:hypothetical protein